MSTITGYQASFLADYYASKDIPVPEDVQSWTVQAAVPTVQGPVFVDTDPGMGFKQFTQGLLPQLTQQQTAPLLNLSAPLSVRTATPTFTVTAESVVVPDIKLPTGQAIIVPNLPTAPTPPVLGVPRAEVYDITPDKINPNTMIHMDTPTYTGGSAMALPVIAAPIAISAIRGSMGLISAGTRTGGAGTGIFGRITGSGKTQAILGLLGGIQLVDWLGLGGNIFSADEEDQLVSNITELIDSDYILWDEPTTRAGVPIEPKFVVVPLDPNERPYAMGYRPFSRSTMRKMESDRNTIRRTRTPRRRRS